MTPREAASVALGAEAVLTYERVKSFYTRFGGALESAFAAAVSGRLGARGEPDVVTRLGGWEFCAAANTKNSAGEAAQRARVGPGRIVQVSGDPRPGRISGRAFLELHGVRDAARVAGECELAALRAAAGVAPGAQLSLAP